jgi:hypothetical protein
METAKLKVPYVLPFFRALFNGTKEADEIALDRTAPDEYWACVGVDKTKLPHLIN